MVQQYERKNTLKQGTQACEKVAMSAIKFAANPVAITLCATSEQEQNSLAIFTLLAFKFGNAKTIQNFPVYIRDNSVVDTI